MGISTCTIFFDLLEGTCMKNNEFPEENPEVHHKCRHKKRIRLIAA
jgi:hypothetical protein